MIRNELLRGPENFTYHQSINFWPSLGKRNSGITPLNYVKLCISCSVSKLQITSFVNVKRNKVKMCLQGGPKNQKMSPTKTVIDHLHTFLCLAVVQVTSRDHIINIYLCWC